MGVLGCGKGGAMKKPTRTSLASALESLVVDSHLHFNDMIVSANEVDSFVEQHMQEFMDVTRKFVAERI